jgi:hypothetical protein
MVQRLLPGNSGDIGTLEAALADNLYEGYIKVQGAAIKRLKHHDSVPIPADSGFQKAGRPLTTKWLSD